MTPLLVADIGGTNGRFGLVAAESGAQGYTISSPRTLRCDDYSSLAEMADAYCAGLETTRPEHACFALAGPVKNNTVQMTNRDWLCSGEQLCKELGMSVVQLLNDYAALSYAAPHLKDLQVVNLFAAAGDPNAAIAVMGAGTGFGVSASVQSVIGNEVRSNVISSEGGHVGFAPNTATEIEILKWLLRDRKHACVEDLLSGRGIVNIYRALAEINDQTAEYERAEQISAKGLSGEDALCKQTLTVFCELLGSVAGDKALNYCALGGVYIGGGITPRLDGFLQQTDFVARFQNKGAMSEYVSQIPISLIKTDNAAVIGCGVCLQHLLELKAQ